MEIELLLQEAIKARENAYVPYSKFKVGAAIKTTSGKIFTGCNVENSSYGLTNCAERTAIFKAISEGHRSFEAIAIVGEATEIVTPCGGCRQVLAEFGPHIQVIMGNLKGDYLVKTSGELLPHSFQLKQNK